MANRDNFRASTIRQLAQRVGYVCSRPGCGHMTIGPQRESKGIVLLGEAAHICAAAPKGPRYDPKMTSEERRSYENGIWLCPSCAALIDKDEQHYSVETLHQWKMLAEDEAGKRLEGVEKASKQGNVPLADDEKIVLCYMISNQLIKASKAELESWCTDEEIHKVNLENARILLSTDKDDCSSITLDLKQYRQYLSQGDELVRFYYLTVDKHRKPAVERIIENWESFSDSEKLYLLFFREIKYNTCGDRWKADQFDIPSIKEWENKNDLKNIVSDNYGKVLGTLIEKKIVFASEWTSHGNVREYTLFNSAYKYLISDDFEYEEELDRLKGIYTDLPF